ncbi:enhancer of split M1 protein [Drosophila miranda]|uniref:enhancer of split M1 protein n=1 Tax=Drosophila miranda TaxID=7229 RepID=UPI0007E7A979|nr:enhancer of split M1 protein [Drosophila miranda]
MMFQTLTLCCLALVTGIAANTVSTNATDCPQFCAAIYRPVCATDGKNFKEFASDCNLKSDNCRRERNNVAAYAETDSAWCSSELVENIHEKMGSFKLDREECFKPCSMIYQPICVTNGKYRAHLSNVCLLETFNCALQATGAQPTELLRVLRDSTC